MLKASGLFILFMAIGCSAPLRSTRPLRGAGSEGTGSRLEAKRYDADRAQTCPSGMSRGGDGFCRPPNRQRE